MPPVMPPMPPVESYPPIAFTQLIELRPLESDRLIKEGSTPRRKEERVRLILVGIGIERSQR